MNRQEIDERCNAFAAEHGIGFTSLLLGAGGAYRVTMTEGTLGSSLVVALDTDTMEMVEAWLTIVAGSMGERIVIHPELRAAAHAAVDRWLDECLRVATAGFQRGQTGDVGKIGFRATSEESGLSVVVERTHEQEL